MQGRKLRGRPRTVWVGTLHVGTLGKGGTWNLGEPCSRHKASTCESLEAGVGSVCVWKETRVAGAERRRERVAGAVGEVGRRPQIVP